MRNPIQGLDFACMTINEDLSKACFEHGGYIKFTYSFLPIFMEKPGILS